MRNRYHLRLAEIAVTSVIGFALFAAPHARAGILGPNNMAECVLDRMPGVANDSVGLEIYAQCSREFPVNAPVEKRTGFFAAYHSGAECTLKKAKDTPSPLAARFIQGYCYMLYEQINPFADPSYGAELVPK